MKLQLKHLMLFAIMNVGTHLFAQQTLSLQEAVEYGVKNNYSIKMSDQDFQKSERKVREILAIGLPQISANGSFTNYINIPTSVIPANAFNPSAPPDELVPVQFGTDFNVTGTISVTQLLFDGSYLVGLQATKNLANLSRLNIERTERDVRNEIAKAYYTALVADENVKTLKQTLEVSTKLLDGLKIILENGLNEQQDVDQLILTVSTIKNALARAELMRNASYLALKLQMGMTLETEITLSDNLEAVISALNLESFAATEFNVEQNLDYQMLSTQVALNELNMDNEKMKNYPSLGAFFNHQYQAYRLEFDFFADKPWYPATMWGLQLQVPIFSSGMRKAKIAQARIEMEKSEINLQQLDQALKVQAYVAKSEFLNAVDAYRLQKESLALAESIQNKTLAKYKEGIVSSLDLNQAQNQYLTQQINYINSLFTLLTAKANFEKLMNSNPTK